ncbi:hypothetical protein WJX74_004703 [Apatococcus lobatus]|uniref:adenylate kinase n=1 Tax=Apatococcus lobatus TaxID=904363 RepID=A0AAW1R3C8_9CHLO
MSMLQRAKAVADIARKTQSSWLDALRPSPALSDLPSAWVFLGPPGVGKGTYASRMASKLGVTHIAAGDLVRAQIRDRTPQGLKIASMVTAGDLIPDTLVLELLQERIDIGRESGETGCLLDGFPRTLLQAEALPSFTDVQLAVNLSLREEALIAKCRGRRICGVCNKNYNVADIDLPSTADEPAIQMPPLNPPATSSGSHSCREHLQVRLDDAEDTIRHRLQVYHAEARPIEEYFRERGQLLQFSITGGIPETMPRLESILHRHSIALKACQQSEQQPQLQTKQQQHHSQQQQSSQSIPQRQAAASC